MTDLFGVVRLVDPGDELLQLIVFLGVSPGLHAPHEFVVLVDVGVVGC